MKRSALALIPALLALLSWTAPSALAAVALRAPATVDADQPAAFSVRAAETTTVAFSVDGKTRWTKHTGGRDFRRAGAIILPAGRHQLAVRATNSKGGSSVSAHVITVKAPSKSSGKSATGKTTTHGSASSDSIIGSSGSTGSTSAGKDTSTSSGTGKGGSTTTTPSIPSTPVTTPSTPVTTPSTPITTPTPPVTESSPPPSAPTGEPGQALFSGTRVSQYLNQSAPGAVTEVPDPAGSGETVFQEKVSNADVYPITPTENPRAELVSAQNIHSGAEFWANMKFYLPTNFPSSIPSWLTLLEGPYGEPWAGTPPWHLEVNGTHIQWQRNGTYNWDTPWQMNLVRGSWVHVLLHERFASDGWIEMWIDGQPITFFANTNWNPDHEPTTTKLMMQTMDSTTNIGPCSFHLMNYRKAGMLETATVDQGPLRIGTSRSSVEAS